MYLAALRPKHRNISTYFDRSAMTSSGRGVGVPSRSKRNKTKHSKQKLFTGYSQGVNNSNTQIPNSTASKKTKPRYIRTP